MDHSKVSDRMAQTIGGLFRTITEQAVAYESMVSELAKARSDLATAKAELEAMKAKAEPAAPEQKSKKAA